MRRSPAPGCPAPDGGVVGVIGGPNPAEALCARRLTPSFADDRLAMSGAVTVTPGGPVVGGRIVTDAPGAASASGDQPRIDVATTWSCGDPSLPPTAMVGAAIYDPNAGSVDLVRDPLGERTIYFSERQPDGTQWFSDRLTELRRIGAVGGDLDLEALRDYLIYAYVPGTQTMFRNGSEVAPGTSVRLHADRAPSTTRWWDLVEGALDETGCEPGFDSFDSSGFDSSGFDSTGFGSTDFDSSGFDSNARRLRMLLDEAVAVRRPAGPVGVYLSGGVDSSAITALLCEQDPTDVHTVAVHFGRDLPHELDFVDQVVARSRPGQHHEIELTAAELTAALPDTMAALDDPIGDPLTVPNLALGRRAAQFAPVIFNGEGGDPVFGGPKNQPMLLAALYGEPTDRLGRSPSIDTIYLRSYQKCFNDLPTLLRPEVHEALSSVPAPEERIAAYLSDGPMTHFVNRLFAANTRLKGSDHILTKVANVTAAAGVVGRSPLFDRAVVESAFAMPPGHKLAGTVEKAVLKAAIADIVPQPIVDRPKAGMRVPVQTWFRGPLRREGSKRLLSRRAKIAPYIERDVIKNWTRYDGDPSGKYGRKLWLLLSLEYWLEAHT